MKQFESKTDKAAGVALEAAVADDRPIGTPPGGGSWAWKNGGWTQQAADENEAKK